MATRSQGRTATTCGRTGLAGCCGAAGGGLRRRIQDMGDGLGLLGGSWSLEELPAAPRCSEGAYKPRQSAHKHRNAARNRVKRSVTLSKLPGRA